MGEVSPPSQPPPSPPPTPPELPAYQPPDPWDDEALWQGATDGLEMLREPADDRYYFTMFPLTTSPPSLYCLES